MNGNVEQQLHISTPLIESFKLGEIVGFPVFLKCENCQPTGSFKLRGFGHFMSKKYKEGVRNFITASGGNAGLALAYGAKQLGIQGTVLVPKMTPKLIVDGIERLGSKPVIIGDRWVETNVEALRIAAIEDATYISPFDHPLIWTGNSTAIDELTQQLHEVKPSCIVVAVGGGGFLAGIVEGLKRHNWNDVPIVGVETEGAACLNATVTSGTHATLTKVETIAYTLSANRVAKRVFEIVVNGEHPIISVTVSDEDALDACYRFLDDERIVVEPSCGAPLAALYNGTLKKLDSDGVITLNSGPAVVMVCGGAGVSLEQLHTWKVELSQKSSNTK